MSKVKIILLMFITLALTSCAQSVDLSSVVKPELVGFWHGIWHGMIASIAFIVSLFNHDVAVYAVYNTGGWYDFGFLIGVGGFSLGLKSKSKSKSKQRPKPEINVEREEFW